MQHAAMVAAIVSMVHYRTHHYFQEMSVLGPLVPQRQINVQSGQVKYYFYSLVIRQRAVLRWQQGGVTGRQSDCLRSVQLEQASVMNLRSTAIRVTAGQNC